MSFDRVKAYLEEKGLAQRIRVPEESSATVELAAQALGCAPQQIAKTLSFLLEGQPILVVAAGDARVDNHKFKETFGKKPSMIPGDQVEAYVGHQPGGVCPFAVKPGVVIYLDVSLKANDIVYPAAGSGHSAVELSLAELEQCVHYERWVDVCKARA